MADGLRQSRVNLHEHEDFQQVVIRAARHHGLDEQFVEKDYYVTEVLRVVQSQLQHRTIFKGGTSLSKGWGLTTRFSEDIDLFVDPEEWEPALGAKGVDRVLKELRDAVAQHPALTYLEGEGQTIGGKGRQDYFAYESVFSELPGLRAAVLLEPGIQSGKQPTERRTISSLVADYLMETGEGSIADDLGPFEMTLLHYRRTFVEKLFTIHARVERMKEAELPLDRWARHYADLEVLARDPEVQAMLESDEYGAIKSDYDRNSRKFYGDSYRPPDDMSFRTSDALFPSDELRARLEPDYIAECDRLFNGPYPSFDQVLGSFALIRDYL